MKEMSKEPLVKSSAPLRESKTFIGKSDFAV